MQNLGNLPCTVILFSIVVLNAIWPVAFANACTNAFPTQQPEVRNKSGANALNPVRVRSLDRLERHVLHNPIERFDRENGYAPMGRNPFAAAVFHADVQSAPQLEKKLFSMVEQYQPHDWVALPNGAQVKFGYNETARRMSLEIFAIEMISPNGEGLRPLEGIYAGDRQVIVPLAGGFALVMTNRVTLTDGGVVRIGLLSVNEFGHARILHLYTLTGMGLMQKAWAEVTPSGDLYFGWDEETVDYPNHSLNGIFASFGFVPPAPKQTQSQMFEVRLPRLGDPGMRGKYFPLSQSR